MGQIEISTKEEGCFIVNLDKLKLISNLLKIDNDKLNTVLTSRIMVVRGQSYTIALTADQGKDTRDALSKALYDGLFNYLVDKINEPFLQLAHTAPLFVGVLDIFGFENFKVNSIEQLCINYTNERLQYYFNQHIFKEEQIEYEKERINWNDKVGYVDNLPCLDLIDSNKMSIFSLLNEECIFPKSTDMTWLQKLETNLVKHPFYKKPRLSAGVFAIVHYAGEVIYDVKGFLDKNKDPLPEEITHLIQSSPSSVISKLLKLPVMNTEQQNNKKNTVNSVVVHFRNQLNDLMKMLQSTEPHYIRCLKPNMDKEANSFKDSIVLTQLSYTGMLDTIKLYKSGYPKNEVFEIFFKRYHILISFIANYSKIQNIV